MDNEKTLRIIIISPKKRNDISYSILLDLERPVERRTN